MFSRHAEDEESGDERCSDAGRKGVNADCDCKCRKGT